MTNILMSDQRKVTGKGWWFFLFLVTIVTLLLMPQTVLAQPKATDLNLWLHGNQNDYNLEVRAGQDNKLFLDVRNYGTDVITNIKLSVEAPQGWIIAINPTQISALSAGNVNTVDVNINPAGNATTGGQNITFTVQSDETTNQKFPFFITVKPAQVWIWVWVVAGLVVIAGFVLIYLKFSKQ